MAGRPTYYELLGVDAGAGAEELKRAYRARALALHPDRHIAVTDAERRAAHDAFRLVNEAWRALRDPVRRAAYDRTLTDVAVPSPGAPARPGPTVVRPDRDFVVLGAPWASPVHDRPVLAVDGAHDLSGLRQYGADALWGLYAGDVWVGDDQLVHVAHLTGLHALDLANAPITDAGLRHLRPLTQLEDLGLWGTAVTDAGLAEVARLPAVTRLSVGSTAVGDPGMAHLACLAELRVVNLRRTSVSSIGIARLLELPSLRAIALPWHVRATARRRLGRARPDVFLA